MATPYDQAWSIMAHMVSPSLSRPRRRGPRIRCSRRGAPNAAEADVDRTSRSSAWLRELPEWDHMSETDKFRPSRTLKIVPQGLELGITSIPVRLYFAKWVAPNMA